MYRSTSIVLVGLFLFACKATETPSSSSSSSSRVSSTSSATSSAAKNTAFSDFNASVTSGASQYESTCMFSGCHGANGEGGNSIRWSLYDSNAKLHRYIEDTMPKGGPERCVGQCAANITAYLAQFRVTESACAQGKDVLFSERAMPLLTPYEYKNAILDLFNNANIPHDFLDPQSVDSTMGFPNSRNVKVAESQGRRYFSNANSIAEWNQQNGAVRCTSTNRTQCANEFIAGFAKMAFRRPLEGTATQQNSEAWYFHQIFNDAPTVTDGLKWAIVGALTSPHFLYRSEIGKLARDASTDAAYKAGTLAGVLEGKLEDYQASGAGVTANGSTFTVANGEQRTRDGKTTHLLWTNGGATKNFSFTGSDILTVTVGGNDYNGRWPDMTIKIDNTQIAAVTVSTPEYKLVTYQYLVLGKQGSLKVELAYNNDAGINNAKGEPGTDIDLYIGDVTVAPAKLKNPPAPTKDFTDKLASLKNDSAAYVLDPYEFASVLSFMLTGSGPDQTLMDAAAAGALNSNQGVAAQVKRLLATAKAERHMKYFVALWFRTDRLDRNADLPEGMAEDMRKELQEFFWHIFSNEDVPFSEFYSANYTFLNAALAKHYGVTRTASGQAATAFVRTPLDSKRGGVATMGAFLASFAHGDGSAPILRGVHVREDMLCHHIGPPPSLQESDELRKIKEAEAQAAMASRTLTTREFYRISTDSPGCGTCHYEDINPLGFAMADFDGLGKYRTDQIAIGTEGDGLGVNRVAIDAEGALWDPEVNQFTNHEQKISVNGARELSLALAKTQSVQFCLTEKAFRLAVNRPFNLAGRDMWNTATDRELTPVEAENFACAQEQLGNALRTSNQSLITLFETLGNLDLMRFRR